MESTALTVEEIKKIRSFLEDISGFSDGCGCCSNQAVREIPEYTEILALLERAQK